MGPLVLALVMPEIFQKSQILLNFILDKRLKYTWSLLVTVLFRKILNCDIQVVWDILVFCGFKMINRFYALHDKHMHYFGEVSPHVEIRKLSTQILCLWYSSRSYSKTSNMISKWLQGTIDGVTSLLYRAIHFVIHVLTCDAADGLVPGCV